MAKIAVLSDTRMPTLPVGGHGLGRMAHDMAKGFRKRGHDVTLYAGAGSVFDEGKLIEHASETERAATWDKTQDYDFIVDLSHFHDLSRLQNDLHVLNWLVDTECRWNPPNQVVGNAWQAKIYPDARVVPLGINPAAIPFREKAKEPHSLRFAAKIHPAKGADIAERVAVKSGYALMMAGTMFTEVRSAQVVGEIRDQMLFYQFLGEGYALLAPSRVDAGGRVILEASACGTPVLTLDWSGAGAHVEHCVSGLVAGSEMELVEMLRAGAVDVISRKKAREWVCDTHSIDHMLDGLENYAKELWG